MGVFIKDLFSFNYPEFKTEKCVTGWTWSLCPSLSNPTKKCKQNIYGLCTKTKTSRFRIYAKADYPNSVDDYVKKQIEKCHLAAAGVAANIIYSAATASGVVGPQATIVAAVGAIPAAAEGYSKSFYSCINTLQLSNAAKDLIKVKIHKEDKGLTDWREAVTRLTN